jgi:hypothetical protein
MKKLLVAIAAAVLVVGVGVTAAVSGGDSRNIMKFRVMAPVTEPYTDPANPIRGVPGGGLPWIIDSAHGRLRSGGRLAVEVDGLVLAKRNPVPPELRGKNPSPTFEAIVSCLSAENGIAKTVNVATDPVPATMKGDAEINAVVDLPSPCLAPIVFVASGGGSWFAVTGA